MTLAGTNLKLIFLNKLNIIKLCFCVLISNKINFSHCREFAVTFMLAISHHTLKCKLTDVNKIKWIAIIFLLNVRQINSLMNTHKISIFFSIHSSNKLISMSINRSLFLKGSTKFNMFLWGII